MEKIIVIDFGSQYSHQIVKSIMNLGVCAERIKPPGYWDILRMREAARKGEIKGIIFSGGPASVYEENAPKIHRAIFQLNAPILGICYGMQLVAYLWEGKVESGKQKEYGESKMIFRNGCPLFKDIMSPTAVWASHGDSIAKMPENFELIGLSWQGTLISAMADEKRKIYGVQFHPEVSHTKCGQQIFKNFLEICGCNFNLTPEDFACAAISDAIFEIKNKIGQNRVAQLISGGIDSLVTFVLLNKTLGQDKVIGLYIDNGLMRDEDEAGIDKISKHFGWNNIFKIRASSLFLNNLKETTDPEEKRQIIGELFYLVRDYVIDLLQNPGEEKIYRAQGTIYPDTIESAKSNDKADKIKTHHNLVRDPYPELLAEPLRDLFKDEVRKIAKQLGIPDEFIWRKPFPGPGLAIRTICSRAKFLYGDDWHATDEASKKLKEFCAKHNLKSWILPVKSVGVQGDKRTYVWPAIILPKSEQRYLPDIKSLKEITRKITNTMPEINRVLWLMYPQYAPIDKFRIKEAYISFERSSGKGWLWQSKRIELCQNLHSAIQKGISNYITSEKMYGKDGYHIDRALGQIWQIFPVLLPASPSGDGESVAIRAIKSQNAMTVEACELPWNLLQKIVWEILNFGQRIEAIFYDLTDKPPATIEWE